jgi:small subunit ribosomal protein S21
MLAKGGRRLRIAPAATCGREFRTSTVQKGARSRPHGATEALGCESDRVSEVVIKEGESFETALKRFMRKVQQDGLLSEAKRRQHYEPPSVKRKRKADARARKARKARAKAAAQGL